MAPRVPSLASCPCGLWIVFRRALHYTRLSANPRMRHPHTQAPVDMRNAHVSSDRRKRRGLANAGRRRANNPVLGLVLAWDTVVGLGGTLVPCHQDPHIRSPQGSRWKTSPTTPPASFPVHVASPNRSRRIALTAPPKQQRNRLRAVVGLGPFHVPFTELSRLLPVLVLMLLRQFRSLPGFVTRRLARPQCCRALSLPLHVSGRSLVLPLLLLLLIVVVVLVLILLVLLVLLVILILVLVLVPMPTPIRQQLEIACASLCTVLGGARLQRQRREERAAPSAMRRMGA